MSKLFDCLMDLKNKSITSCRKNALDYSIEEIDEYNQKVDIRFSSGTPLGLTFATFNAIIDYLVQNKDRYIRIGSTLKKSLDSDTLEYVIQSLEPDRLSYTKRAVHICDILFECGFISFGKALNPKTKRYNQAAKWKTAHAE